MHIMGDRLVTIKLQEVLGKTNHLLSLDTTQTAQKTKQKIRGVYTDTQKDSNIIS